MAKITVRSDWMRANAHLNTCYSMKSSRFKGMRTTNLKNNSFRFNDKSVIQLNMRIKCPFHECIVPLNTYSVSMMVKKCAEIPVHFISIYLRNIATATVQTHGPLARGSHRRSHPLPKLNVRLFFSALNRQYMQFFLFCFASICWIRLRPTLCLPHSLLEKWTPL